MNCIRPRSRLVFPALSSSSLLRPAHRLVSTLPDNPQIYVHKNADNTYLLTLLPTEPASPSLALGTTTTLPPIPKSFAENRHILPFLKRVIATHAADDPAVQSDALMFASPGGNVMFAVRKKKGVAGSTGAGGANVQGGMGGGGRVGWLHVHDERRMPDFGRIPDPEDIFGSVEVDAEGKVVRDTWEDCPAYRLVTRDGVMRLSAFLREKMVEALKEEEEKGALR